MQTDIREHVNRKIEFAVCIFDCNDLKSVNDVNGHDKGDIYLKETAAIICEVYKHSPVFRVGGDEFAALLLNRDYRNRDELLRLFDEKCAEKRKDARRAWEKVSVARGMAVYDPEEDESVNDVVRRADKLMYENKWNIKGRVRGE
jgi:diguanylate cyclase (GGDEF)-like protein